MGEGVVEHQIAKELEVDFQELLQERFNESKQIKKAKITPFLKNEWIGIERSVIPDFSNEVKTGVNRKLILEFAKKLYDVSSKR